ncbi:MAG TPA: DNA ligase D, partial [Terriglobia bacterium]|nr:DNA ligase D [Terriglobia bacterium]
MKPLTEYRRKRRFKETPEPAPQRAQKSANNRFVIQKHDATRLHYDFRLEIDGVLKSWAVPKGPSLNPADKRLAMETEDHPLEYAGFEGVIPEGNYGAGPVIIWDRGTFTIEGETPADRQWERGELKFVLHGQKLRGGFVLVKLHRPTGSGKPWLLIKHRDAAANPRWKIEAHDGSVVTARNLQEVEAGAPASAAEGQPAPPPESARKTRMPRSLHPMLATLVDKPFSSPDWLFEIKWDGVRALAWIEDGKLELRSRTGRVITSHYPELASLPEQVRAGTAILDGEIVVLDRKGRSRFELLQPRINVSSPVPALRESAPATYFLFDLLYSDGYDLRNVPLIERKERLRQVLDPSPPFVYTAHQFEKGRELLEAARKQGLEGIIGKRKSSFYSETRSPDWVKFKITREVDAVIGGYTAPRNSREFFGALLLGLYEGKALRFISGVGTGFDRKKQEKIYHQLQKLKSDRCYFDERPQTKEKAYWVQPKLVARVKYGNWTKDRHLRVPVFLAILKDHRPEDCWFNIETPAHTAAVVNKTRARKAAGGKAPALGMDVLSTRQAVEKELFRGSAENVLVEINGKRLRLSHLNKVYFPQEKYRKRDLLAYYFRAAEYVLPFLKDRPLVLRRYPDGITGESFFQKEAGEAVPDWMETIAIPSEEKRRDIHYFIANDLAALLYLTNLGCIDHNPWAIRRDDLERPDFVFFDLDPSEGTDF